MTNDNISNELNIYQRLVKAAEEVGPIEKDVLVEFKSTRYKAQGYDTIISRVKPFLLRNGILMLPTITKVEYHGNRLTMWVTTKFLCPDDPNYCADICTYAHSDDTTDKGPGKAYTYAVKMALQKVLMLVTGENEEEVVQRRDGLSATQMETIRGLAGSIGRDDDDVLGRLNNALGTSYVNLEGVDPKYYTAIINGLKRVTQGAMI